MIPIAAVLWWLCFYMALDSLSDMGIELKGPWSWIVVPVAPVLAMVSFFLVNLSGFGQFLKTRVFAQLAFAFGAIVILLMAFLLTLG
jgi:hypothetical protein